MAALNSTESENPLRAKYYADAVGQYEVQLQAREQLAKDTYLVRFRCPELAASITPGQFLMVRSQRTCDALLGRAFALYNVVRNEQGKPESVDIVFHIVGKMTEFLAVEPIGTPLVVWGPLGNGFNISPTDSRDHLVMVAGGIGQTPFLTLAKECLGREQFGDRQIPSMSQVSLCYGARSREHLAGVADFRDAGVNVHVATDDGSEGHHGLVTTLLESVVQGTDQESLRIVCCGPEPMMQAVSAVAEKYEVPCEVSLETPMACGLGICFSCVTQVKQPDGSWDFKRTCVDGPVFDSQQIVW